MSSQSDTSGRQEAGNKLGLDVVIARLAELLLEEESRVHLAASLEFDGLEAVRKELSTVAELQECLRHDDPFLLGPYADIRQQLSEIGPSGVALDATDLLLLAHTARSAVTVHRYFEDRTEKYPLLFRALSDPETDQLPFREVFKAIDLSGEILDSASSELQRIRRGLTRAQGSARKAALDALRKASAAGFAAEEQPTIRGGRLVIPVRAEAKRRVDGFVHDVSASGQTVYIEPAASLESNNRVRELEYDEIRECHRIRVELTELFREVRPLLKAAWLRLVRADILQAKARLANEMDAIVPSVEHNGGIQIIQARNPELMLVFNREGGKRSVVPFDLDLGGDNTMIVISGPNAGGKSVTMKAVGLMALMVSKGLPIPVAPGSRFDLFDTVHADIGDEQSMSDDLSTFTSHLKNLSNIITTAGPRDLALIDEAGTGTDPEAGGAMARAILEVLHRNGVRTIVTTHYGPLKLFAHETDGIQNASMTFDQDALRPTYEFNPGIPGSSYAREIAARSGMPDEVIERSAQLVDSGQASAESLIQDLMRRNAMLEESLIHTEAMRKDLEARKESLQTRLDGLQEERDRIKEDALRSADTIMRDANRAVEKTIRDIRESAANPERTKQARVQLEEKKAEVKQAVKKTEKKRRSRSRRKQSDSSLPDVISGPIRVGDRVRLSDGQTIGEVLEMKKNQVLVAFASMQMKIDLDRLIRVGGKSKQEVKVRGASTTASGLSVQSVSTRLDIRGKRADEALAEIVPFVDRALAAGVERIEVLHGKGTGALRSVLHDFLSTVDGISRFDEAPIMEGGAGVTHIHFAS